MGQNDAARAFSVARDIVDFHGFPFLRRPGDEPKFVGKFSLAAPCAAVHEEIARERVVTAFALSLGGEFLDRGLQHGIAELAFHGAHRFDGAVVLVPRHESARQLVCVRDEDAPACPARDVDGNARHRHLVDIAVDGAHGDVIARCKFRGTCVTLVEQRKEDIDHGLIFHRSVP